jgi:hypothetical protein
VACCYVVFPTVLTQTHAGQLQCDKLLFVKGVSSLQPFSRAGGPFVPHTTMSILPGEELKVFCKQLLALATVKFEQVKGGTNCIPNFPLSGWSRGLYVLGQQRKLAQSKQPAVTQPAGSTTSHAECCVVSCSKVSKFSPR